MGDGAASDEERRIAELLRVNAELAAEIRDLKLGRASSPRPGQLPAARRVSQLWAERDSLAEQLGATRAQLGAVEGERDGLRHQRDDLLRQRDELQREALRLRSGIAGLLRRIRARLLRS